MHQVEAERCLTGLQICSTDIIWKGVNVHKLKFVASSASSSFTFFKETPLSLPLQLQLILMPVDSDSVTFPFCEVET